MQGHEAELKNSWQTDTVYPRYTIARGKLKTQGCKMRLGYAVVSTCNASQMQCV